MKMIKETHKRLYHWHSIGGLVLSVFLIALCSTALPILFKENLEGYLLRLEAVEADEHHGSMTELSERMTSAFELSHDELIIRLGHDRVPITAWVLDNDLGRFNGYTLTDDGLIELTEVAAIQTIAEAHYNFLIPAPYGLYFVGFIGLLVFSMMIVGTLLHVKWRKEAKTFRKRRSFRLWVSDLHKLLGLWLLPFHLFVSYTGAALGLGGLLVILVAVSSFNGDQDAAIAAVLGEEPEFVGEYCEPYSIEDLLAKAENHWLDKYGGSNTLNIDIHHPGDCGATMAVASGIPGRLLISNALTYNMVSGELLSEIDWIDGNVGERWYAALGPLHFGHFGGAVGQWFYALSTIFLVVLIISGLLLWLDKQQIKPLENKLHYFYISKIMRISMVAVIAPIFATISVLIINKCDPLATTKINGDLQYILGFFISGILIYFQPKLMPLWIGAVGAAALALIVVDVSIIGISAFDGVNTTLLIFSIGCGLAAIKWIKASRKITIRPRERCEVSARMSP